jgi:hypothetical protein
MRRHWNRRKEAPPKRRYIFTNRHGIISQNIVIFNAGVGCSAVMRRGFYSAAAWGCFEVTAGRRVYWKGFCILETKIVVDFALRLTVIYGSVRRHKRNIHLLIINSYVYSEILLKCVPLCFVVSRCSSVVNYSRNNVYLVLLVLSSELSLWLQQILFSTYKKINFKFPFVHFYTVRHFHYTYVPAAALTLKYFAIHSPCFNTTLLKITSNLHPKCI